MHEPFGDLNHEFPTERASLNLQGTKASISRFIISELNPIEVHLCHEEQSLATAHVDFGQIFEKSFKTAKIDQEPLRISGKSLKNLSGWKCWKSDIKHKESDVSAKINLKSPIFDS